MKPHFVETTYFVVECSCGQRCHGRDERDARVQHDAHVRRHREMDQRRAEQKAAAPRAVPG